MPVYSSVGVYTRERDLSLTIHPKATSIGCIIGDFRFGKSGWNLVTSPRQFLREYGYPKPGMYDYYSALAFLEQGRRLWVGRAICQASPPTYAGAIVTTSGITPLSTGYTVEQVDNQFGYLGNKYSDSDTTKLFLLLASSPGSDGNKLKIAIKYVTYAGYTTASDKVFYLIIETVDTYGNTLFLDKKLCSLNPDQKDGSGNSLYIEDVLKYNDYVKVYVNVNASSTSVPAEVLTPVNFAGGTDGGAISDSDRIALLRGDAFYAKKQSATDPDKKKVNIFIGSGTSHDTHSDYVAELIYAAYKRGDSFVIADVPSPMEGIKTPEQAVNWRKSATGGLGAFGAGFDASYASLYYPWVEVYDRYNDKVLLVPPSGYVASAYAFNDYIADVWYSPAGLNRGILQVRNVDYITDLGDRDHLFEEGQINPIRLYPEGGIVIWGDKTLTSRPSLLSFINIRRYLNYLKVATASSLDYTLFEPHDVETRLYVKSMIEDFLDTQRGHYAAWVVCDERNNSPADIDRGQLNVDVFIKPKTSIRYIQLTYNIMRYGMSIEEAMTITGMAA